MPSNVEPIKTKKKRTRVVWLHRFLRKTRKLQCPDCGRYTFVPYYNIETGRPFDGNLFGKCDRAVNCGCHRIPHVEDYRARGLVVEVEDENTPLPPPKVAPTVEQLIMEEAEDEFDIINPRDLFQSMATDFWNITLFRWFTTLFDKSLVLEVFRHYMIGYSPLYSGSPLFWQIDIDGNIRTGKVMGYNPSTGKRMKNPVQIWYEHKVDYKLRDSKEDDFRYVQCLYGEHLIPKYNKFAVVESEKTAILCTLWAWSRGDRDTLWLATSGLECIRNPMFRVLEGRDVTFYPDKGKAHGKWKERITQKLSSDIRANYKISSCLEKIEKLEEGDDIGDYILLKLKEVKEKK